MTPLADWRNGCEVARIDPSLARRASVASALTNPTRKRGVYSARGKLFASPLTGIAETNAAIAFVADGGDQAAHHGTFDAAALFVRV